MRDAFGRHIEADEVAHARMVRQSCDECGSRAIDLDRWSSIRHRVTLEQADTMTQGFEMMGLEPVDDPVAWVCLSCGNLGMFGPWEAF